MTKHYTEAELLHHLEHWFGYKKFKENQLEVIQAVLRGEDVLAVMATGSGKSICYWLPALIQDERTIIITPTISLVEDQYAALSKYGVKAGRVHSKQQSGDKEHEWDNFLDGGTRILYTTPEQLMKDEWHENYVRLKDLKYAKVSRFVIDEAHCVLEWGQDFREDYGRLSLLKQHFPAAQVTAFTATATPETRAELCKHLSLGKPGKPEVIVGSFSRPNLIKEAFWKQDFKPNLIKYLHARKGETGIIYMRTRGDAEKLAGDLKKAGFNVACYHGGMNEEERNRAHKTFRSGKPVIMVATNAFGMGVDKPDVRFVLHADVPASIDSLYQEMGRAGRDGKPADVVLFYNLEGISGRLKQLYLGNATDAHKEKKRDWIVEVLRYGVGTECRNVVLLRHLGEDIAPCGQCDNCLNQSDGEDLSEPARLILSGIVGTGGFFAATYVIKLILGVMTDNMRDAGHHKLSVFGKAKNKYSRQHLNWLILQLIGCDALELHVVETGLTDRKNRYRIVPKITDKGERIRSELETFLAKPYVRFGDGETTTDQGEHKDRVSADAANDNQDSPKGNPGLLAELIRLRDKLAKGRSAERDENLPDQILNEIAGAPPTTRDEFLAITGLDKMQKPDEYFPEFSPIIDAYLAGRKDERVNSGSVKTPRISRKMRGVKSGNSLPTCPDFYLPVLQWANQHGNSFTRSDCETAMVDHFGLTPEQQSIMVRSGNTEQYKSHVQYAIYALRKNGLLGKAGGRRYVITELGREKLASGDGNFTLKSK